MLPVHCRHRVTWTRKKPPRLAAHCESLREDRSSWLPAEKAEAGNVAIHQTLSDWDLRVVAKRPDKRISLIRLAKDKSCVAVRPDHLAVVDLAQRS